MSLELINYVTIKEYIRVYSVILFSLFFVLIFVWFQKYQNKPRLRLPPGPIGLPVFGYLPFLGSEPFRTLDKLAKKYGKVFSLYFGRNLVVILGDYEAVKETFSKPTTTDRPEKLFDFLPGGVGFSSVNGEEWMEQRRYCVKAMRHLGLGRGPWEAIIQDEVQEFVKLIHGLNGQPVNICKLLTSSISNNVASMVLGKRLDINDPTRDFLDDCITTVSQFFKQSGFRNYFPRICDIFVALGIGNYKKQHDKLVAFNQYIKKEVEEHKLRSVQDHTNDFISGYLEEMKAQKEQNPNTTFNEINLCGNATALLQGASDTTRTSLNWLLLAMVEYPSVQKKIHEELDSVLGPNQRVAWEDRLKLPYTYATIMEGQRWKTVAPLNTSRIAQEDIKICEYDIPKGATIIANFWGIHNDERYWEKPELFMPERFLKNNGKDINLKPENYLPFSYGKRNCPGEVVAMMEMLLYFSALMQDFEITAPPGKKVKLDAILGLTYQAVQQELCLVCRMR